MTTAYFLIDAAQVAAVESVAKRLFTENRMNGDEMRNEAQILAAVVNVARQLPAPSPEVERAPDLTVPADYRERAAKYVISDEDANNQRPGFVPEPAPCRAALRLIGGMKEIALAHVGAVAPETVSEIEVAQDEPEAEPVETFATVPAVAPSWAKAAIVAELHEDDCDLMTDYFNVKTTREIVIGWSTHTKDLFSEMRKAAATFPATAHLGPGCDIWSVSVEHANDVIDNGRAYWKGHTSHWHGDALGVESFRNERQFTTEAEARAWIAEQPATEPHPIHFGETLAEFAWKVSKSSVEHREKYSMGHGYYLKAGGSYNSGWTVAKRDLNPARPLTLQAYAGPVEAATPAAVPAAVDGITVSQNAEKGGIEIRFPGKPDAVTRDALKAGGFRWSRFSSCWYRKDSPAARAFAESIAKEGR